MAATSFQALEHVLMMHRSPMQQCRFEETMRNLICQHLKHQTKPQILELRQAIRTEPTDPLDEPDSLSTHSQG